MRTKHLRQHFFIRMFVGFFLFFSLTESNSIFAEKFVLPVFPDTQTEVMSRTDMFNSRMNWVVNKKVELNIPIVLHVGDIVNFDNITHWQNASAGFEILDRANIPYAVCLGNHDTEAVGENSGSAAPGNVNLNLRKTTKFNTYFPVSRFTTQKGRYETGKSDNAYYTFTAGGLNWLVLSLEFCSRQGPVDWANSVVSQFPNHNVIILTHYHLTPQGSISTSNAGYGDLSPVTIFDQFIKKHANIILVLSGHVESTSYRTDIGENGNKIYQLLQNYQNQDYGGGYIRLLEIDTELKTMSAKMYSPFYNITKEDVSKFAFSDIEFIESEIPTTPIVKLKSGVADQKLYTGQFISNIIYGFGGSANACSILWTGTENTSTPPDGVVVDIDNVSKLLTISGKLNKPGVYSYKIIATDDTNLQDELEGTLTAKTTTKSKLAYVTRVENGLPTTLDSPFITALNNDDFDVNIIPSTSTNVDYSPYDLIVLSAIPNSGDAGLAELKTITQTKPFVNMKMFVLNNGRWGWLLPYNNNTRNTIIVPDSTKSHPIFKDIDFTGASANEIKLTNATSGNMLTYAAWLNSSTASANPRVLATTQASTTQYSYLEIPVGTRMNGMITQTTAKHIILGLSETAWGAITTNAIKIVVNAAKYVVALPPVISLNLGTAIQIVAPNNAISDIIYSYSGTVTSTDISWTGTDNESMAPEGIIVTTNSVNQTITISGTPSAAGIYGFTVLATDGAVLSKQTGILRVSISTNIKENESSKKIFSKEIYDISGRKILVNGNGLFIEKTIYTDGSTDFKTVFHTPNNL